MIFNGSRHRKHNTAVIVTEMEPWQKNER